MPENNFEKRTNEDRMKEITEQLEKGVEELFTSENYKTYLNTMSKFHTYSFNNTVLIAMQKPDASVEEILQHQAETGSGNLLDRAKPEKSHAQKERCVLARTVYLYIQENRETGYALKWSDWLETHSQAVTMKMGDSLDGEGFSSDPLVVSDSLEAVGQGSATVLTEEGMVLFISID